MSDYFDYEEAEKERGAAIRRKQDVLDALGAVQRAYPPSKPTAGTPDYLHLENARLRAALVEIKEVLEKSPTPGAMNGYAGQGNQEWVNEAYGIAYRALERDTERLDALREMEDDRRAEEDFRRYGGI